MKADWRIALASTLGFTSLGWVVKRHLDRRKLVALIDASPLIMAGRAQGLIPWSSADKAAEMLPILAVNTPDEAMAAVLSDLPKVLLDRQTQEEPSGYVQDLKEGAQATAKSAYEMLPKSMQFDLPGIDLW